MDTEFNKDDLLEGFKCAVSDDALISSPEIIHVLLEHGLDAQSALNIYYYNYWGSLENEKNNKKVMENAQSIIELLEKFGATHSKDGYNRKNNLSGKNTPF